MQSFGSGVLLRGESKIQRPSTEFCLAKTASNLKIIAFPVPHLRKVNNVDRFLLPWLCEKITVEAHGFGVPSVPAFLR